MTDSGVLCPLAAASSETSRCEVAKGEFGCLCLWGQPVLRPRVPFRRYERRAQARVIYIPHGQRVPALRFSETNDEPGLG